MTENATEHVFNPAEYAGFWVRFIAAVIDMVIYVPVYYVILFAVGENRFWWAQAIFFLVALFSYSLFFASKYQASPGMYMMKFHVCNTQGKRMSYVHAVVWGLVGAIGWIICGAGLLYLQLHFDMQAVQDMLTSCKEQNIDPQDCTKEVESIINIPINNFFQILISSVILFSFLSLIWALSIGLAKDKTGFNNLICRTRFINGRVKL